jgi:hypothetical protein
MAYILTRVDKGTPLTYHEVDSNFTNLNDGKLERAAISSVTGTITSSASTSTITSVSVDTLAVGMIVVKTAGTGALGTDSVITDVDPTNNTITVVGSTSHTAGSVTLTAHPALSGAYISDCKSLTVNGDLTVTGTTTNINTTNLVIEDKNVILGDVATPSNTTADGGGITLKGATDKTLNWVNSTSAWTSSEDFNLLTGKVYEINGTTVLSGSTLGSGVTASSLTSVGTLTSLGVSGATTITIASGTSVPLTVTNAGTGDTVQLLDASGDTTMFRIDASGNLGIGVASGDTLTSPIQYGTLTYSPGNPVATFASTVSGFNQLVIQNKSNFAGTLSTTLGASSDIIVNNDVSTDTNFFGDFGINSSTYAYGGAFGDVSGTYLYSQGGTLSVGTGSSNNLKLITNSNVAVTIDTSQNVGVGVVGPTATLHIKASSGSLNTAPIKVNAGTNIATIEQGTIEYNGSTFFTSPQSTYRGLVPAVTFTSGLSPQNGLTIAAVTNYALFPGVNDTITLPIGLYRFELVFRADTTAAVANIPSWSPIGLGNAAGTTSWQSQSVLTTGAAASIISAQGINAATATAFAATTSVAASRVIQIRGLLRITTAGTIIPAIQYSGLAGTLTTYADNYIMITPIATGTGTGSTATVGWA